MPSDRERVRDLLRLTGDPQEVAALLGTDRDTIEAVQSGEGNLPAAGGGGGGNTFASYDLQSGVTTPLAEDYGPFSGRVVAEAGLRVTTQDSGDGHTDIGLYVDNTSYTIPQLTVMRVPTDLSFEDTIGRADMVLHRQSSLLGNGLGHFNGMGFAANGETLRLKVTGGDAPIQFAQMTLNILHVESGALLSGIGVQGGWLYDGSSPYVPMVLYGGATNNGPTAPYTAFDIDALATDPTTLPLLADGIYIVNGTVLAE